MTWVEEAFGEDFIPLLWEEEKNGWIRRQTHPTDDCLMIHNYTEKAVFEKHWNKVTLNCRGLILAVHDGLEYSIEARPFSKFFNYGESTAPEIALDDPVEVTDKIDGSLGIGYVDIQGVGQIATRGSFDSDQARHANRQIMMRRPEYRQWIELVQSQGGTALFEIVYPENRIVVDYGTQDDLVLLGIVDNLTGKTYGPSHPFTGLWPGPKSQTFEFLTFGDALAADPRPGKEGFVVRKVGTEDRVKLKQEDYVALHKIVLNLNARGVWERMKDGALFTDIIEDIPDEFHEFVGEVFRLLIFKHDVIHQRITEDWNNRPRDLPPGEVRKYFAEYAKTTKYPWAMFSILDNKPYDQKVWQLVRPEAGWTPNGRKTQDEQGNV